MTLTVETDRHRTGYEEKTSPDNNLTYHQHSPSIILVRLPLRGLRLGELDVPNMRNTGNLMDSMQHGRSGSALPIFRPMANNNPI